MSESPVFYAGMNGILFRRLGGRIPSNSLAGILSSPALWEGSFTPPLITPSLFRYNVVFPYTDV